MHMAAMKKTLSLISPHNSSVLPALGPISVHPLMSQQQSSKHDSTGQALAKTTNHL